MRRLVSRFCSNNRGNVAMTFGLAAIPILGVMGVAVDYTRASHFRSALQSAVDSVGACRRDRDHGRSDHRDCRRIHESQPVGRPDKERRDVFARSPGRYSDRLGRCESADDDQRNLQERDAGGRLGDSVSRSARSCSSTSTSRTSMPTPGTRTPSTGTSSRRRRRACRRGSAPDAVQRSRQPGACGAGSPFRSVSTNGSDSR